VSDQFLQQDSAPMSKSKSLGAPEIVFSTLIALLALTLVVLAWMGVMSPSHATAETISLTAQHAKSDCFNQAQGSGSTQWESASLEGTTAIDVQTWVPSNHEGLSSWVVLVDRAFHFAWYCSLYDSNGGSARITGPVADAASNAHVLYLDPVYTDRFDNAAIYGVAGRVPSKVVRVVLWADGKVVGRAVPLHGVIGTVVDVPMTGGSPDLTKAIGLNASRAPIAFADFR
jgi:hypothetical protein